MVFASRLSRPRHGGNSPSGPAGFTLVELIVVLAIIGVLIGLLLPAVQRARESARQVSCRNNLRSVGIAILNHESAKRVFPVGCDNLTARMHAWSSFILPYLEEGIVAARIDYEKPWDDDPTDGTPGNRSAAAAFIATYICPSAIVKYPGKQDYFGLGGIGLGAEGVPGPGYDPGPETVRIPRDDMDTCGMLYHTATWAPRGVVAASVTDGLSHTLMVSESTDAADGSELANPDPAEVEQYLRFVAARWAKNSSRLLNKRVINDHRGEAFFSNHPGAIFSLFGDGRVVVLREDVSPAALVAVSTRNGGEIQSDF